VLRVLTDDQLRGKWDLFFHSGGVIQKLSETEGYVYYQTLSQWMVWPRDFVMAISARFSPSDIPDQDEIRFVGTSVELDSHPPISSHVRGNLSVGGYHLVPVLAANRVDIHTKITYVLQIDAAGWLPTRWVMHAHRYRPENAKLT
jgi:hypothetical protein